MKLPVDAIKLAIGKNEHTHCFFDKEAREQLQSLIDSQVAGRCKYCHNFIQEYFCQYHNKRIHSDNYCSYFEEKK